MPAREAGVPGVRELRRPHRRRSPAELRLDLEAVLREGRLPGDHNPSQHREGDRVYGLRAVLPPAGVRHPRVELAFRDQGPGLLRVLGADGLYGGSRERFLRRGWNPVRQLKVLDRTTERRLPSRANKFAFQLAANLERIVIPASVGEIGFQAFDGCSGIASLQILSTTLTVEKETFRGCVALRCDSVEVGEGISRGELIAAGIPQGALEHCPTQLFTHGMGCGESSTVFASILADECAEGR